MKEELLDIDALLSCVEAELQSPADIATALAHLKEARDAVWKLIDGLDQAERN